MVRPRRSASRHSCPPLRMIVMTLCYWPLQIADLPVDGRDGAPRTRRYCDRPVISIPSQGGGRRPRFHAELNLGDNEAAIVAGKDVHLPGMPLPGNHEAGLFDQTTMAQRQQRFGIEDEIGYSISRRRSSSRFDLIVTVASVPFLMRTRVVDRSPEPDRLDARLRS